jgi:hypothetical protein
MAMDPDIAARLARYAKERRTRSYLDDEPLEGTGWTKELDEMREIEFDSGSDYDWENDVEITDDNYTKDEDIQKKEQKEEEQRIQKLCEELAAKVTTKLNEVTSVPFSQEEYNGLGSSSRVAAFKFDFGKFNCSDIKNLDGYKELVESGDVGAVLDLIADNETLEGMTWVRFHKFGTEVLYGPMTYGYFRTFEDGGPLGSYGNAVRTVLEPKGYTKGAALNSKEADANKASYEEFKSARDDVIGQPY